MQKARNEPRFLKSEQDDACEVDARGRLDLPKEGCSSRCHNRHAFLALLVTSHIVRDLQFSHPERSDVERCAVAERQKPSIDTFAVRSISHTAPTSIAATEPPRMTSPG